MREREKERGRVPQATESASRVASMIASVGQCARVRTEAGREGGREVEGAAGGGERKGERGRAVEGRGGGRVPQAIESASRLASMITSVGQ